MHAKNKQLMQTIMAELCLGNDQPLIDAMAEDMQWHWMGTGPWAKSFIGKSSVVNDLLTAARTAIIPPAKAIVHRILADGDYVIAECTGQNTTTDGKAYHNNYCWVCRFADGQLKEINEYMDTQLVTETFIIVK
jgi:ketosteroid isomerase-like protein